MNEEKKLINITQKEEVKETQSFRLFHDNLLSALIYANNKEEAEAKFQELLKTLNKING